MLHSQSTTEDIHRPIAVGYMYLSDSGIVVGPGFQKSFTFFSSCWKKKIKMWNSHSAVCGHGVFGSNQEKKPNVKHSIFQDVKQIWCHWSVFAVVLFNLILYSNYTTHRTDSKWFKIKPSGVAECGKSRHIPCVQFLSCGDGELCQPHEKEYVCLRIGTV